MEFLDRRIEVICNELKKLSVKGQYVSTGWKYKEGLYLTPAEADADKAKHPFRPFDAGKMHWYGPDAHYWFRGTFRVPKELSGKQLWMYVATQIEGWDARNPQFLFFVNGRVLQGVDMNHKEVLVKEKARAGEELVIDLQAYTGTEKSEFSLIVYAFEKDAETEGLYYDLKVPLSAFARLGEKSEERRKLEIVLNDAINLIDLRTPYSAAYYESVKKARSFLAKHLYRELAGDDRVIASCIGHTHIDVAWWWTVAQTKEKTPRSFATVLKLMEEYPEYKFMSSQPQLYQFLVERYPELMRKIRARVKEGRWEPEGGMWLEADCNLTSGESLVRQFMHGKRFFREQFGVDNVILWLPDVFGYSGALPQIMERCGIRYFMTTKLAWNQYNKMPYDTFYWEGIDGTRILTHLVTTVGIGQDPEKSYFTTYNGELHPDALLGGWHRYQQKDINNDILISYGFGDGGGGPTREMLENGRRMAKGICGIPKVRQCFSRTFFEELEERVKDNRRTPAWIGELYFEYHRGTYTSMARNKRANRKSELLMMDLEFLSVLAKEQAGMPVPVNECDRMWKTILLNQFHDILPGSSIHEVYEVTKKEYADLEKEGKALVKARLDVLSRTKKQALTVWNTTGFAQDMLVSLEKGIKAKALTDDKGRHYAIQQTKEGTIAFVRDVPAKGCVTLTQVETLPDDDVPYLKVDRTHNRVRTKYYDIAFDRYGRIKRLYDRKADREVFRKGESGNLLRMYEDKPIYYDNWDIDNYYTEKFWDVTDVTQMEWTETGPLRATLCVKARISNTQITQKIRICADSRRIDFETEMDWGEHQHLLKVIFPVDVHTDEATFEIQFGNVKRKIHQNTSWDRARFESCGQKWADISEGHYGVSLLNDCKYGHSFIDGNMALTLVKSGIEPNPVADVEHHVFTYALYPHQGMWRAQTTVREAYNLNQPGFVHAGAGVMGERYSYVSCDSDNVVIETVKTAEDGKGVIVRLYECENARTKATLHFAKKIRRAVLCDCLEQDEEEVPVKGTDSVTLTFRPYEIKTLRIV